MREGEARGEKVGEGEERAGAGSYTHLRDHETVLDLVCGLLLEKKKATDCNTSYIYIRS